MNGLKGEANKFTNVLRSMAVLAVFTLGASAASYAQEQATTCECRAHEVGAGAHFLIRLNKPLSTKDAKAGESFTAWTLDPLVSGDGTRLTPGAEIAATWTSRSSSQNGTRAVVAGF